MNNPTPGKRGRLRAKAFNLSFFMRNITLNLHLTMSTKIKNSTIEGSDLSINDTTTKVVTVSISPESIADLATAITEAVVSAVGK